MARERHNIIRLGTRARPFNQLGIGNKARLLNVATKQGLPVPIGVVVVAEAWQRLEENGVLTIDGPDAHVHAADDFLALLGLHQLKYPVSVRSAFAAEDGADRALAGYFHTVLNVPPDDPDRLIHALIDVWRSADRQPGAFRRDILVMQMIAPRHAGVAFTQAGYQDDIVNYTTGTADTLVGGVVPGEAVRLPQLRHWEQPSADIPAFLRRLQRLLQGVRRAFSLEGTDWDIEWADDGTTCWLLQVRPITQPPRRNEAFTFANLKEILPDPPSRLMTSIVADASADFFAWYRQFDRTLPADRPMVEIFYGRPLFNLSLLTDMMRYWGLPTALVTGSIGGQSDVAVGVRWSRFFAKSIPLLRLGWAQLHAARSARRQMPAIAAAAADPGNTIGDVLSTFRDLFVRFVTEMFNLTQAMSGPLLILRRTGTLAAHNATHRSVATAMYTDLAPLRDLVAANPAWRDALRHGRVPDDPAFREPWDAYLARYGHRGIYESDIARPRFAEDPTPLLHSLAAAGGGATGTAGDPPRTWRHQLTRPVWWQLRRVLDARERWRSEAIRGYAAMRARLLPLVDAAVADGRLPARDAFWQLTLAEAAALDQGKVYSADFFARRAAEIAAEAAVNVPDLVHRFDDLEVEAAPSEKARSTSLRGVSLTDGAVTGRAWVLQTPSTALPDSFDPAETILVARSVDAGWIPTFGQVAGVVVEIGGDLSHGSIILREIGLPAVTNVAGATAAIATGDRIRLDAGRGSVSPAPDASVAAWSDN